MATPDAAKPKPTAASISGRDPLLEEEKSGLDILRENANVVFAGALLVLVITFALLKYNDLSRDENLQAWDAIRGTSFAGGFTIPNDPDVESLESYKRLYRGTDAEPYILLQYANALYKRGKQTDLTRAAEAFAELEKRFGGHALIGPLTKEAKAKVEAELELMKKLGVGEGTEDEGGDAGSTDAPPLIAPPGSGDAGEDPHAGHDHGPGEGHDDHGDGEDAPPPSDGGD